MTKHTGYHKLCKECQDYNLAEVDKAIFDIHMTMLKPNYKSETASQMRIRADRRREMATSIKIAGGEVKEDYE